MIHKILNVFKIDHKINIDALRDRKFIKILSKKS